MVVPICPIEMFSLINEVKPQCTVCVPLFLRIVAPGLSALTVFRQLSHFHTFFKGQKYLKSILHQKKTLKICWELKFCLNTLLAVLSHWVRD